MEDLSVSASLNFAARQDIVKGSIAIASMIDFGAETRIAIEIVGPVNKKSLIADAIVNALDDDADNDNVPEAGKMMFEHSPASALKVRAEGKITSEGKPLHVYFVRKYSQFVSIPPSRKRQLIIYSSDQFFIEPQKIDMRLIVNPIFNSDIINCSVFINSPKLYTRQSLNALRTLKALSDTKSPRAFSP